MFQFPLHRDPRCNVSSMSFSLAALSFSSLYIGILAATVTSTVSTLIYNLFQFPLHRDPRCNLWSVKKFREFKRFSSLYIGILAATYKRIRANIYASDSFSSLYIGILAATALSITIAINLLMFQFPLHRDPRCNLSWTCRLLQYWRVSVPFTSGSSLQLYQLLVHLLN